ncbi:DUF1049 domain-containing protein [Streptomyces sp. NPDC059828]|uniref:DUF1049 domain-containing protein n=1 Tax=Streptomyces sp. NPDC059828 TaxID=3346965 RepID=UPI00365EE780
MSPKGGSRSDKGTGHPTGTGGSHGRFTTRRVVFLVLAVLTLVFIFENTRKVTVRLLIPEVVMPLYLALLAAAILGALCTALYFGRRSK